jgi:hypothetical protein
MLLFTLWFGVVEDDIFVELVLIVHSVVTRFVLIKINFTKRFLTVSVVQNLMLGCKRVKVVCPKIVACLSFRVFIETTVTRPTNLLDLVLLHIRHSKVISFVFRVLNFVIIESVSCFTLRLPIMRVKVSWYLLCYREVAFSSDPRLALRQ